MAANTLLSELGGEVILGSQADENVEAWLADGTAKAGWLVGVDGTDLKVVGCDDGAKEFFIGILLPRYDTDCDTALTSGDVCEVVVPISGHYYAVAVEDPSATLEGGHMLSFGTDPGNAKKCSTFDGGADIQTIATNKEQVITGTRFLIIRWL